MTKEGDLWYTVIYIVFFGERTMTTLSYIVSLLGLSFMILASLIKGERMKTILFLVFCSNLLVGTSYLLKGSGINGAAALYLGAAQTLINYFFQSKGKSIPKWLIMCYAVAIVVINIWVANGVTALGLLVIVASLTFIFCIGQTSGAGYRFWTIINLLLWCVYDVFAKAYSALLTHVILLLFTVLGMIIYDRKTAQKPQGNE